MDIHILENDLLEGEVLMKSYNLFELIIGTNRTIKA